MRHGKIEETKRGDFTVVNAVVFCALSIGLLVALTMSSWYGWKYGGSDIDVSAVVGQMKITYNGNDVLDLDVDDELNASVNYVGIKLKGRLMFAGADTDSILYQLKRVTYDDGTKNPDAVLYIRIPRTGVQGEFMGPWMVYYAWNPQETGHSDWAFMQDDGVAYIGSGDGVNAVAEQRKVLLESSSKWMWSKEGSTLSAVPAS